MNDIAVERKKALKEAEQKKKEEKQQKALKLQEKRKLKSPNRTKQFGENSKLLPCVTSNYELKVDNFEKTQH